MACTYNRLDVMKLLLDRGCDMNVRDKVRQVHCHPVNSQRVACYCCLGRRHRRIHGLSDRQHWCHGPVAGEGGEYNHKKPCEIPNQHPMSHLIHTLSFVTPAISTTLTPFTTSWGR